MIINRKYQKLSAYRPRPSECEWMKKNIIREDVRDEYFNILMYMCFKNYQTTSLIDDIWVSGIQSRDIFKHLTDEQQTVVRSTDTNVARCFINGVDGVDWNIGLSV